MHRIAISNADPEHHGHAPFAWPSTFDSADDALLNLPLADAKYPADEGYSCVVESLHTAPDGKSAEWVQIEESA